MGWKSDYELRKEQKKANKAITKNSNYFVNKKTNGVSSGTPSVSKTSKTETTSVLPKASETTPKLSLMERVKLANDRANNSFAKSAVATTVKPTSTVRPQPWNGGTTTLSALPKASLADKINIANINASNTYAKKAADAQPVTNKRLDYGAAAAIGKTIAGGAMLAGTAKQSLTDWQNKVKTQGIRSALDDYTYNLDNPQYSFGNTTSKNTLGYRLYQEAEENQNRAKAGLPRPLQTASDIGISLGSMALTLPTAAINPMLPTALMAANTAGNKTYNLTKQGKTATEALGRGLVSGTLDYAAKKIGYEDFFNLAKNGTQGELMSALNSLDSNAKNAIIFGLKDIGYKYYSPSTLGALTWDAVRSGLAGAARTLADSAADTTYDKDAKINWEEVAKNGLTDALFSVLNNGAGYIGNRIKSSARGNTTENATSGTTLPTVANNQYAKIPNMGMLPYGSQYPVNTANVNINNNGMSAVDNYKNNINVMPRATDTKTTIAQPRNDVNNFTDNNVYNVPNLKTANSFAISDYVDKSLKNENSNMFMKIGEVSEKLKNDLSKIGLKAKGFVHAIRDNDIRHIEKSHGLKSNDKYKVSKEDYLLLNDIFNDYDVLYKGYNTKEGNTTIAYEKVFNNKIYVVEEVYKNGVLSVKQIIKTGQYSKPSFLKKYQIISSKNNASVVSSMTHSTDYTNSPPGDHVQDVIPTANNNILESTGKINTDTEKNIAILPTAAQSELSPITISDNNNALPTVNDEQGVDVNYSDYTENEIKEAMTDFTPHEQGIINAHINESKRTLPMAKGNNSSSVMRFTLRTDAEKKLIEKYNVRLAKTKERYKNKITDIKANNKEKLKTLKAENKEKLDRQDLAARMAVGRAKAETKRKYENKITDINVKHAEANERAAKKREMSKLGDKVLKNTRKLNSKIKYMPPEMQEKVRNTIKNIDTKAKSISGKSIKEAIEVKAYVELMQSKDPDFVVSKDLQEKIDRLNKIRVSDMSYGDLKELDDTLKGLQHEFATYNKTLGTVQHEFAKDMSAKAQVEVKEAKAKKNNFFNKIYNVESLNMSTVFNVLGNFNEGGAMSQIREEFIDGQRKATKYVKEATQLFDEFLNNSEYSKELKSWGGKKAKRIDTGLVDNKGEKIYMTPGERIDIYLNSLNENNKASMENAGYTFMNLNALRKNDYKNLYRDVQPVILKPEDIKRIVGGMTEAEKEFAKIAFKYFNTMSTNAINEVSMITHGYERAQEKNYYPKAVDKDTIVTEFNLNKTEGNINNAGFLKERTGTTGVAIKGRNAVDVVIDAISDVSKLVGYGVPMRDFSMIWNTKNDSGTTLKKAVLDTYGNDMIDYVNKFVKDLNSVGSDNYFIDVFAGKLMSNYAASVLSANPKVSLQQTASIVTAAPEVGGANIIKGLFGTSPKLRKSILSQIDKRTGYRWDRAYRGNSTAELNALNTGGFKAVSKYQNVKDFANPMKWIRNMDLWATDEIACAAYFNILNKNKYEVGSDEFWNAVTKLYETTLENTQPMYNIMQRTGISRSKSAVAKAFNMFATQRNQNYNMMYSAYSAYKAESKKGNSNEKKKAAKKLRSTILSLATANAVVVAMTSLAQAVTNDKKLRDENGNITVRSVMNYYKRAYLEAAVGNIYLGTQIYNIFNSIVNGDTYYGTEEVTLDMINDIVETSVDFTKNLTDYIKGAADARQQGVLPEYMSKEKSKAFKSAHDFAIAISKMTGVPLSNAEKYTVGIIGFVSPKLKTEYEALYKDMSNQNIKKASGKQRDEYLRLALEDRAGNLDDATIKAIQNIYNSTEDSKILPKYEAPETISQNATKEYKAIKHEMSAKDKSKYMSSYSKILEEEMPELVKSSYWKNLSDDEKIATLNFLYGYADKHASKDIVKEYRISDTYNINNLTVNDYKNYINNKKKSEENKKQGVIE
jgi:hypothetical protein